jgi:hypothetical protein
VDRTLVLIAIIKEAKRIVRTRFSSQVDQGSGGAATYLLIASKSTPYMISLVLASSIARLK